MTRPAAHSGDWGDNVRLDPGKESVDFGGYELKDVAEPKESSSAATKNYVDEANLGGNPMTTQGDMVVGGASGILSRLAVNSTATPKFVKSVSGATSIEQPSLSDLAPPSADFSMGANKITALKNPTAVTDACNLGTARGCHFATSSAGVKNAYTMGITPPLLANAAGVLVAGTIAHTAATNDAAATLAVDGLAALPIVSKAAKAALTGGEVASDATYLFLCDGTNWVILA